MTTRINSGQCQHEDSKHIREAERAESISNASEVRWLVILQLPSDKTQILPKNGTQTLDNETNSSWYSVQMMGDVEVCVSEYISLSFTGVREDRLHGRMLVVSWRCLEVIV